MSYSSALSKYQAAYNAKAQLEANPLMEEGVLEAAQNGLTGRIYFSQVVELDSLSEKIAITYPAQIAEQQQLMDEQRATILEMFNTKGHELESVLLPGNQVIFLSSGAITIREATADDYPSVEG